MSQNSHNLRSFLNNLKSIKIRKKIKNLIHSQFVPSRKVPVGHNWQKLLIRPKPCLHIWQVCASVQVLQVDGHNGHCDTSKYLPEKQDIQLFDEISVHVRHVESQVWQVGGIVYPSSAVHVEEWDGQVAK